MDMQRALAQRNTGVEWSGIRVMFALADEIPGVINLGIGQPDFDTPAFIREAAKQALDDGYTRYPPAKGFQDLREAIAACRGGCHAGHFQYRPAPGRTR
jgi:aspartate/methionine/tyrosine aminotransferase